MAQNELSANQERARFIAMDVHDHGTKAPAGYVIDSSTIRIIAAKEDDRPHTQTVARIIEFLDDLRKGTTELKERQGRKIVIINPDAAKRLSEAKNHARCDRGRKE